MTIAVLTFSKASAQDIETLVMPGQVLATHQIVAPETQVVQRLQSLLGRPNVQVGLRLGILKARH